jgi:hypothetical protein
MMFESESLYYLIQPPCFFYVAQRITATKILFFKGLLPYIISDFILNGANVARISQVHASAMLVLSIVLADIAERQNISNSMEQRPY